MPTNGLSLVGFMADQQMAVNHLRNAGIPGSKTDVQLIAEWQTAQSNLGAAISRAGQPNIKALPASHQAYDQQPRILQEIAQFPGASVMLVEIDPLLAFQPTVDVDRSTSHCSTLSRPPTLDELLALFLPIAPAEEDVAGAFAENQSAAFFKSRNSSVRIHNVQVQMQKTPTVGAITFQFGLASPMAHVSRFNGRCYLTNGYHRAYGARLAGATEMPCIFRDVTDLKAVGIKDNGLTFALSLLESANAPTMGHFAQGRTHAISLRATSRLITVNWTEGLIPEET